jgi:hypothetical protein
MSILSTYVRYSFTQAEKNNILDLNSSSLAVTTTRVFLFDMSNNWW